MDNVKVIVADIDGTLVKKYANVTPYQKSMIEKAQKQGILFGIASGRPLYHCIEISEEWGLKTDFFICNNGCNLYDSSEKKEYNYDFMEPEWCKEAIDLMDEFGGNCMMYWNDVTYVSMIDEMTKAGAKVYQFAYQLVDDMSQFYQHVEKLMFRVDEDKMALAQEKADQHPSQFYKGFRTQPNMLEFSNVNVSKGETLKRYCAMKGISVDDVVAFGDTQNDEDMLVVAGVGVCMINGDDSTKACADMITEYPCTEDGVGRFIEKYILK